MKALLALLALLLVGRADAASVFLYPYTPNHVQQHINLGLIVEAQTVWFQLSTGGGWTLECDTNSPLTLDEQRSVSITSLPGITTLLSVPITVPATYEIPGWMSIQANSCRQCTFKYKGSAVEGSASLSGVGINFNLSPGTEQGQQSTLGTTVCRQTPNPQCCTPGCQLP